MRSPKDKPDFDIVLRAEDSLKRMKDRRIDDEKLEAMYQYNGAAHALSWVLGRISWQELLEACDRD